MYSHTLLLLSKDCTFNVTNSGLGRSRLLLTNCLWSRFGYFKAGMHNKISQRLYWAENKLLLSRFILQMIIFVCYNDKKKKTFKVSELLQFFLAIPSRNCFGPVQSKSFNLEKSEVSYLKQQTLKISHMTCSYLYYPGHLINNVSLGYYKRL